MRRRQGLRGDAGRSGGETGAGAAILATLAGAARLCRTRPGEVIGSFATLAAAAAVSLNALGFQAGRHPAPILPKVAVKESPARKPAERPAQAAQAAQAALPAAPATEPAPKAARSPEAKPDARAAAKADPIGDILRNEDTTASVTPKPDKAVIQAQKALAKLGYGPLKADGVMGSSTRAAIEKFEKDRKLPVRGEPSGRTLRELAARSGITG